MPDFGTLRTVDPRKCWPNEATNFTPWLAANIGELGRALGIELELVGSEADCGDFSLDLLAKDLGTDKNVIIENQLSATDHDHLGKLLTYAAGFDAGAVVWIAPSIREEHRQALEWLNQRTDTDTHFFGVVVEVLQIDDSRPAFNFKLIVFPNEWQKRTQPGGAKPTTSKGEAYRKFFQGLIDELREKHKFTGARIGQAQSWYAFSSGFTGIIYGASFAQGGRVRTDLYLNRGEAAENKALFDKLLSRKDQIEEAYGSPLEWERLDDRQASRVAVYFAGTIEDSPDDVLAIRQGLITRLLKFKKVFGPIIQQLANGNTQSNIAG